MATEILSTAKIIVVPVGIGVYKKPKASSAERRQFDPLPEVNKDIHRLCELFATEQYKRAGFVVLPPIRGTFTTIRKRLLGIVEQMQTLPAPLGGRQLVLLWSGHAEANGDDLRLATADSLSPMTAADGYAPSELVNVLSGARAQGLYVVLDVCEAGKAAGTLAAQAATRMMDHPPASGQLPGFAALCSAQHYEKAKDGLFARVLETVLRDGPSDAAQEVIAARGFGALDYNRFFTPAELSGVLEAEFTVLEKTDQYVQRPIGASVGADFPVFVNPRWSPDALPRRMDELGDYVSPMDAKLHFLPKARGLEPGEQGWTFTGRVAASRSVSDFILERMDKRLLVVTGKAGTGKSALIGRAVALTDPDFRQSLLTNTRWSEADDRLRGTLPPLNSIDAALHLRGLTGAAAAGHIADLLDLPRPADAGLDAFIKETVRVNRERDHSLTIVLDALDEAEDPRVIAESIIKPLVRGGSKVVVGTRGSAAARGADDLVGLLGDSVLLDLSADQESKSDIEHYVAHRLAADNSPYAVRGDLRRRIAVAVGEMASSRFLYAKLATDELLEHPVDSIAELRASLTRGVGTLFDRTLARLDVQFAADFKTTTPGATALAVALAWGEGLGIPLRDQLWPLVATACSEGDLTFTEEHCRWFLVRAGQYVLEGGDGHQAVYRLYHEALHEHLRASAGDPVGLRGRIADTLRSIVEKVGGWPNANPFIVRYLPRYIDVDAVADLEELCTDPLYLARAVEVLGVDAASRVLDRIRIATPSLALVAVAKAVRRARVALTRDPSQLAAQLMARLGGEQDAALVRLVASAPSIAPPTWLAPSSVRMDWSSELQTIQTLAGKGRALTAAIVNGDAILVLGVDDTIVTWDPRFGSMQQTFSNDGMRPISLAVGRLGGRYVVAAGSYEGGIAIRDLATGDLVAPLIEARADSLAIATVPEASGQDGATPPDDVAFWVLEQSSAVYWSNRPSRLCVVDGHLGVVSAAPHGYSVAVDGLAEALKFKVDRPASSETPVIALAHYLDETVLAEAHDEIVTVVGPGGSDPRKVDVSFPIRCVAVTWVDGRQLIAAVNDSDQMLGTASYVTIRQLQDEAQESSGHYSEVIGVGHLDTRLVAVLANGTVRDVAEDVEIAGALASEVELTSGVYRTFEPSVDPPDGRTHVQATAWAHDRVAGDDVAVRGGFDGRIWVWNVQTGAYVGPFGRREPSDGPFHYAKGRELDAISAVAIDVIDGATWVVAADSHGVVAYDAANRQRLLAFTVGTSRLTSLALGVVASHAIVATGSDGGGVAIWDARSGQRITGFTMDDPVKGLWFAGRHVVVQTREQPLSSFELLGLEG